jgi:hypothetical protein
MTRLGLFCLVAATAAYGQRATHPDNAAIAAGTCDIIQADLRINDPEHASMIASSLALAAAGFNPGRLTPAAEGVSQGDVREAAVSACGQIAAAYAAKDTAKAEQVAANLRQMLAQAVAALPATPQAKFARMDAAVSHLSGLERFYRLVGLAKAAFDAGEIDKAAADGYELLNMASQYPADWNSGNAIYFGNWILGRIALRQGDVTQAGQYLLGAAGTPGSPQLNTFGPNATLASELLLKGQTEVVLQYFELCAKFWKMDHGQLTEWTAAVKAGSIPNFGASLLY